MHQSLHSPTLRLSDRIADTRRNWFVGRSDELALFQQALATSPPPFAILAMHGPGGTGKSTLIAEFARLAEQTGRQTILLDGRSALASPKDFMQSLEPGITGNWRHDPVVFIDTYELIEHLDDWLRTTMLPQLPAGTLVVIAGRNPLPSAWTTSADWHGLVRFLALRNLGPAESEAYLERRAIPLHHLAPAIACTYGHPLALSMVADAVLQGAEDVDLSHHPDLVQSLLRQFLNNEPSSLHRQTMEIAAHSRVTTESLLASVFGDEQAHELFEWLAGLSFVERTSEGVFPHDLVRDALDADLRWRHPQRLEQVHREVHRYVVKRIRETSGSVRHQHLCSLMFLHRNNPVWQPYHGKDEYAHNVIQPATLADAPMILDMVRRHEGEAQAAIAAYWLQRQPEAFHLVYSLRNRVTGMIAMIAPSELLPADIDADPVVSHLIAACNDHAPRRPGEKIGIMRFFTGNETARNPSTPFSVSVMGAGSVYTDPSLVLTSMVVEDVAYWEKLFNYVSHYRLPIPPVMVGDRSLSIFTHDWRCETIEQFDELVTRRELSTDGYLDPRFTTPPPDLVLARADFDEAVRKSLRAALVPAQLAGSPLLRSRLVRNSRGSRDEAEHLSALILEAVASLQANPRTERAYRAVHHTYINPAPSQERAAEDLDLPFSTYRRHLATGIALVTEALWHRETQAASPSAADAVHPE